MKKIILFSLAIIICSTVVTTTNTMKITTQLSPSLILISKKSSQKLQTIENDYQKLYGAFQRKYGKIENRYNKPSDLITDLCQDKSINTKHMTPNFVFVQEDVNFLDQEFSGIERQYSTIYAWSTALLIMRRTLKDTCDNLKKRELIRSAARVALRQDPTFTLKCKTFDFFGECDNTVVYNLEHLEQADKDNIPEAIKRYKNILAKNKLDTRS